MGLAEDDAHGDELVYVMHILRGRSSFSLPPDIYLCISFISSSRAVTKRSARPGF